MTSENNSQICDKYSRGSLMGNWYEERLNSNRNIPVSTTVRKVQPNFAFEHSSGIHDLDRLTRLKMPAHDIIINDADKKIDYQTSMKHSLAPSSLSNNRMGDRRNIVKFAGERTLFSEYQPDTVQINYRNQAKLLNKNNYSQIVSNSSSPKVSPNKTVRNDYLTTYMQNYDIPIVDHKSSQKPQQAVKAPIDDIMNSLPINQGEWSLKPKAVDNGFFRHVRTEVTNRPNHYITHK